MKRRYYLVIGVLVTIALAAAALIAVNRAQAAVTVPPTTLGTWNGSPGSIPDNQKPDVLNDYYFWGNTDFSFLAQANGEGATPFIELEPWRGGGPDDCQNGLFASIASNSPAAVSYENSLASAVKAFGHPVVITFAHEFNIGGQYPWAKGNGCGVTSSQWITAWDRVFANVKAGAGGNAFFMWAPNVDPNGSDTVAAQYWPGAANVDLTGVDGYPAFCGCGGTFGDIFGGTFSEIKALPGFSTIPQTRIFISEVDLAPLGSGGFESVSGFISDLCSDGGDGILQFQDGTPALSSSQWTQLDSALAADCTSGSPPVPPVTTPATVPATTATATVPATMPATTAPATTPATPPAPVCATGAPTAAPDGFSADVRGSHVVLSWNTVSGASAYQVTVDRPDGSQWREDVVFTNSATYSIAPVHGTYTYRVRALNSAGNGPWAAPQHFTVT